MEVQCNRCKEKFVVDDEELNCGRYQAKRYGYESYLCGTCRIKEIKYHMPDYITTRGGAVVRMRFNGDDGF